MNRAAAEASEADLPPNTSLNRTVGRYLKRFENYVVAKGITHYATLKDKLNGHFAPKRNVFISLLKTSKNN